MKNKLPREETSTSLQRIITTAHNLLNRETSRRVQIRKSSSSGLPQIPFYKEALQKIDDFVELANSIKNKKR